MSDDALASLVAVGGNSRLAKSIRAHLQWRDRYGRWIDMGRGVDFKVRLKDGSVHAVEGKFVGAVDGHTGQIYVTKDPSGLKDGFYSIQSNNASEMLASLDPDYLKTRGIELGKNEAGDAVGPMDTANVPDVAQIPFAEAPLDWHVTKRDNAGNPTDFASDDGKFFVNTSTYGKPVAWTSSDRNLQHFDDWGQALTEIDAVDQGEREWGDHTIDQRHATLMKISGGKKNDPEANISDSEAQDAKTAIAPYDPDGHIQALIDSGADYRAVTKELQKNPQYTKDADAYRNQPDLQSAKDRELRNRFGAVQKAVDGIKGGKKMPDPEPTPDPNAVPETPTDPNATPAPDGTAPVPSAPSAATTPTSGGEDANLDTDTFDVAREGFLVPTGKTTSDITPDGISNFIEQNKSTFTKGGERLVIDTDAGTAEIYNSADTLDNAKAQAGGIGSSHFVDLAAGKTVANDKNVGAPNNDPQDRRADAQQSGGHDPGSDQAVGDTSAPDSAGSGAGSGSDDSSSADNASGPDSPDSNKPSTDSSDSADSSASPSDSDNEPSSADSSTDSGSSDDSSSVEPKPKAEAEKPAESEAPEEPVETDALGQPIPTDRPGLENRIAFLNKRADTMPVESPMYEKTLEAQKDIQARIDKHEKGEAEPAKPKADSSKPAEEKPDEKTPSEPSKEDTEALKAKADAAKEKVTGKKTPSTDTTPHGGKVKKEIKDRGLNTKSVEELRTRSEELTKRIKEIDDARGNPKKERDLADRLRAEKADKAAPKASLKHDEPKKGSENPVDGSEVVSEREAQKRADFQKAKPEGNEVSTPGDGEDTTESPSNPWDASGPAAGAAYDAMKHDPSNPEVQASYAALEKAVVAQFKDLKAKGITVEFSKDDPYKDSKEMLADVKDNKHLKAFADGGATLPEDHPMNKTVNIDGEEAHLNDVFRAVHDYFGHALSEDRGAVVSFGPKGEWEAWRTHRLSLPEEARLALWDETRGQNTWTNYADGHADMPIADRPFAEQKAGVVDPQFFNADLIGNEADQPNAPQTGESDERGNGNTEASDSGADGTEANNEASDQGQSEKVDATALALERARSSREQFVGLRNNPTSELGLDDVGEFHDNSAVYDVQDTDEDPNPDTPAIDYVPTTQGSVDTADQTSDDSDRVASLPSGVTPTTRSNPEADKLDAPKDFGYQDKPEDYAGEKFMPTDEQRDIVMAVLGGKDVAVQALAGTGKTSTLELIAKRIQTEEPNKKILYIAFNKSVQQEAESRMPGNVESRTGDSLGWNGVPRDIARKMSNRDLLVRDDDIAKHLGLSNAPGPSGSPNDVLEPDEVASELGKVITAFAISDHDDIDASHFEGLNLPFNDTNLASAKKFWADLTNKNGQIKTRNDHLTKMWALSKPDLSKPGSGVKKPADVIFFDEAQDINPVMAKVVRDQNIQKVYVGDGRQAIYGFRGAENELDNVQVDHTLPLTQSWRFGPEVAGYGNRFLSLLDSPLKVVGGGPNGEVVPSGSMDDADAILTRSNAGAVKSIMDELEKGRVVGVADKYKKDLQALVQTVWWLKRGGRKPRMHEDLAGFNSWDELERAVDSNKANAKVSMLYNMVNQIGLDNIQQAINNLRTTDADAAPLASGSVNLVPGAKGALTGRATFEVSEGSNAPLRIDVLNSFNIKDELKAKGFRFDGDKKSWFKEGTADSLGTDLGLENAPQAEPEAPIDVIVTTAHKAKGLEWGNVKIGDDFRGPREIEMPDGSTQTQYPSPEEVRLAYVAVTRAKNKLDSGSLSWVEGYTDKTDEDPKNPSRGSGWWDDTAPDAVPETPANTWESLTEEQALDKALRGLTDENLDRLARGGNELAIQEQDRREHAHEDEQINNDPGLQDEGLSPSRPAEEEPAAETAPEPTPEPETVPEPAPAEEPAPEEAPTEEPAPAPPTEPAPAPEAPAETPTEAPESEDSGDGLPDDVTALEDMAGKIERERAQARPARQRVLDSELDRIYNKIDSLSTPEEAPEAPAPAEPQPEVPTAPVAPPAPAPTDFTQVSEPHQTSVLSQVAEGKDLTPEVQQRVDSVLSDPGSTKDQITQVISDISSAPNKPNTVTKQREDVPSTRTQVSPQVASVESSPTGLTDPNHVMNDVKLHHPGHTTRPNGDVVVQTKEADGKRFDLVVRRTNREEFFAYVQETNNDTGQSRLYRLRTGGKQNHSYEGLVTQLNTGKSLMKGNTSTKLNRKKKGIETLDRGEELGNGPLGDYISGTDLPLTQRDGYNKLVAGIANMVSDPDVARSVLEKMATDAGYNRGLVDVVSAAVARNKVASTLNNPGFDAPTHVSYDGRVVQPGQFVDWTDTDKTIPMTDDNGRVVRDQTGKALTQPNPNYGRVFRARVVRTKPRVVSHTGQGQDYNYTDYAVVIPEQYNIERGQKPSRQRDWNSSGLQIVDSNAPMSSAVFPRGQAEERHRLEATNFNIPGGLSGKTTPRGNQEHTTKWTPMDAFSDPTGSGAVHGDFSTIMLPDTKTQVARDVSLSTPVFGDRQSIKAGDYLHTNVDGRDDMEFVVNAQHDGSRSVLRTVHTDSRGDYTERTKILTGDQELTAYRRTDRQASDIADRAQSTRDLLTTKQASDSLRSDLAARLSDPNITPEELADARETVNSLKPRQGSSSGTAVTNVLQGVQEDAKRDPDVANASGVADIQDSLAAQAQDAHAISESTPNPNDPKYGGFGVKPVNYEEAMKGDQFAHIEQLPTTELHEGDIIQQFTWGGGFSKPEFGFQVLKVDQEDGEVESITGRWLLPSNDMALGTYTVTNGAVETVSPGRLSNYSPNDDEEKFNTLRPASNVDKDYFATPGKIPAPPRTPRTIQTDYSDLEPENSAQISRERRKANAIGRSYEKGFKVTQERVFGGYSNQGTAARVRTDDGHELFTKVMEDQGGVSNEVMTMRVANTLGFDMIHTSGVDTKFYPGNGTELPENRIVMDWIDDNFNPAGDFDKDIEDLINDMPNNRHVALMGLLDYITRNQDRNNANFVRPTPDMPVPIDNEAAMYDSSMGWYSDFADKLVSLVRRGQSPLTSADLLHIRNNLSGLQNEFAAHGMQDQFQAMMNNISKLIDGVNGHVI